MIKTNLGKLKIASEQFFQKIKIGSITLTGLQFCTKDGYYLYTGAISVTFKLSENTVFLIFQNSICFEGSQFKHQRNFPVSYGNITSSLLTSISLYCGSNKTFLLIIIILGLLLYSAIAILDR